MDYNKISSFLDKFKKLISQKEEIKKTILGVISEVIPCNISEKSLKIKNTSIYIEGSPLFKNEILIHKKQILNNLKKFLPNNNFLDIK